MNWMPNWDAELSNLSMMEDASPEVLEPMKDAFTYMMSSANKITLYGGRLMQC